MMRKDREIKNEKIVEAIIKKAPLCRIGLSENNVAYIVPVSFGHKGDFLYFHSAKEGKKIDMIRKNSKVCFEIDIDSEIIEAEDPCDWSMKYYSIIGFGEASFVEDPDQKREALDIIMEHYSGKSPFAYPQKTLDRLAIIKVRIESMTGKKSGY